MNESLVKNAADPAQVRAASKKENSKAQRSRDAWFNVLGNYEARIVMWEILEQCGLLNCGYRPDSETQYFNGKKAVGAWVVSVASTVRPNALHEMSKEAEERERI